MEVIVRQEPWTESPCSVCTGTPCCKNLPLSSVRLENQSGFISLLLSSSYDGIFPALKKSGEWIQYLGRSCDHLRVDGRCSIHKSDSQSMICKSYDAHGCWYIKAFSTEGFSTMIPFDTGMLLWFENKYELIKNRFAVNYNWDELCAAAFEYRGNTIEITPAAEAFSSYRLSFRKSRTEEFLFMPPYKRPESLMQFELITFRLGFPGIALAVTDTCWAFVIKTGLNKPRFEMIRAEYYPGIEHKDNPYSFDSLEKEQHPYSSAGEQWIILQRGDLDILKALTVFDGAGRVKKWASCSELLNALRIKNPDRAA